MIKITADSTCDLSEEIIKAMNITLIPLHIIVGDQVFRDGVDITPRIFSGKLNRRTKYAKPQQ